MNFNGYINLFQFNKVQFLTVNGVPSIVIPCAVNGIKVEQREQDGGKTLSAIVGIKADAVGDAYREKERLNHQSEPGWDESKLTSHQLIHSYPKEYREKLFARLKEKMLADLDEMTILERMEKVLKRDGSEGHADMNNTVGWNKLLFRELDSRSRIGRLSANVVRTTAVSTAPAAESGDPIEITDGVNWDDMPF